MTDWLLVYFLIMTVISQAALGEEPQKAPLTASVDYSQQLARIAPVEPDQALTTFEVRPPFQLELVAAEPLVHDPVALAFDADSRLYVVEMCGYSEQREERRGSVRLLEDTNGDGRFDTSTVFVDELYWPVAVACWDGGVFVADAPDIWYLKDTDGDRKADLRQRVLTGFSHHNVQAMLNSLVWGLDNRLHCTVSTGGAEVRSAEDSSTPSLTLRARDFAFDPRTFEYTSTSSGGQHGMTFDDWGRKFVCTNSSHILQVMYEDRYLERNPSLAAPASRILIAEDGAQPEVFRLSPVEPWRILRTKLRLEGTLMQFRVEGGGRPAGYFIAASGVTVYRGDNWPEEFRGTAVVGDVGSNLIHRMRLEPRGLEFVACRMDETSEFVASRDSWFRPVQFVNGPDGCLYVADMYREIIEHPDSFGEEIKQHLALTSGRDRGRIYRIRSRSGNPDAQRSQIQKLSPLPSADLVALLAHPNAWHRETAARLLYERQDSASVEPLRQLVHFSEAPLGRMHAMYALAGLNALTESIVLRGLADVHPRVREHAVRLAERLAEHAGIQNRLLTLTADPDLGVRYQLAFSLGEFSGEQRLSALAHLARRDAGDQWMRTAVLSSLIEGAPTVFELLMHDAAFRREAAARDLLSELARLIARAEPEPLLQRTIEGLGLLGQEDQPLAVAIVRGLSQGLGRRQAALSKILSVDQPTPGVRRFQQVVAQAAQTAANPEASISERTDAIELLGLSPPSDAFSALAPLIDSLQSPEVVQTALDVLGRFDDPQVALVVLKAYPALTPSARVAAIEQLLLRTERRPTLLDAIEQGHLPASDLTAVQVQRLCSETANPDAPLRQRAVKLLSPARPGKRADVVAQYRPVLEQSGNADRGREVFRKTCVVCHKAEGVGHELGPNLATFAHRGPEAILVSVLDPNREVNPQYATYAAATRDGRVLTGMLTSESAASITLTREEGKQETVLRAEIEELRGNNTSLMPEGLEKNLDPQSMADLIAYVLSLKQS